jgi:hypothetical protein
MNNLLLNIKRLKAKLFENIREVQRIIVSLNNNHPILWSRNVFLDRGKPEIQRNELLDTVFITFIEDDLLQEVDDDSSRTMNKIIFDKCYEDGIE